LTMARYPRYPREAMAKVLVTIEDRLLARLDKAARARGMNRSAFISELVTRNLPSAAERARSRKAIERIRRLAKEAGTTPGVTEFIRQQRDAR
jgi:metal-responsive CopG/Arc/MetJ family transcriptional regulator